MRKIIDHLRKRPDEEKRHILHLLTMFFALIFVLLWVFSVSHTGNRSKIKTNIERDLEPFSVLEENLRK